MAPSLGELCCTAKLGPWAEAAVGSGSSYQRTQVEVEVWPVQGAAEAQGWGWQTVEGCGVEGLPLEAWLKVSGLEELGRTWVVGQAGRR